MRLDEVIDRNTLPEDSFALVEPGTYNAFIKKVDFLETNDKRGRYFKIAYKISDGKYANSVLFDNCNYINSNPQAQDIGRAKLRTLITAAGKTQIRDTDDLLNAKVIIHVVNTNDPEYGKQATIKRISLPNNPLTRSQGTQSSEPHDSQPPQPPKKSPWGPR